MAQLQQTIKTNLKFKTNERGSLYGFVTKCGHSWRGCREDEAAKKKIVFADTELSKTMSPNVLYHVTLMPMTKKEGFIAISATRVQFIGKINTLLDNNEYRVTVTFGHKTIVYDPRSDKQNRRDIQGIVQLLRERQDLQDNYHVANEFLDYAYLVLSVYKRQNKDICTH